MWWTSNLIAKKIGLLGDEFEMQSDIMKEIASDL